MERQRMIAVNVNITERSLGDVVNDFKERMKDQKLPPACRRRSSAG
ncbi:MAG: hypothetical protein ACOY40_11430 [Bacillota bacterium]